MNTFRSLVRNLTNPMINDLSMSMLSGLLAFSCLLTTPSSAQVVTPKRTPTTTEPSATTVVSNRQQELYDQYHGYNKKAVTTASVPTPPRTASTTNPTTKRRRVDKVAVSSTAKSNPSTTDANERTSKKTKNQPTSQPQAMTRLDAPQQPESIEGSPSSRFRIGVRGGVTYPYFFDKIPGIDPVLSFAGGVTFTLGAGAISFQPEINYVRNSFKLTYLNLASTYASDALQVPLLLKFSSGTYAGSRFFLNVGPYASYALSESIDGKTYSLSGSRGRFGFGAALGIGAAVKAGPGHVTLEVRGLYPLGNTESGFSTDARTIYGQGTIGYIFPLGGIR